MRIKIISDGTATGTRIENECGELLRHVVRVTWTHSGGGAPTRAILEVVDVDVEIVGEVGLLKVEPAAKVERSELEAELRVTDKLLEERNRVMEAIPPCPAHGHQCVPHALEWIESYKSQAKALQQANTENDRLRRLLTNLLSIPPSKKKVKTLEELNEQLLGR